MRGVHLMDDPRRRRFPGVAGACVAAGLMVTTCTRNEVRAPTGQSAAVPMRQSEEVSVTEKLDPRLLAIIEEAEQGSRDRTAAVDVLVGLDVPLDQDSRAELAARGLHVRSEIGTVLTGSVALSDVRRLAGATHVVKVEASAPLHPEPGNDRE